MKRNRTLSFVLAVVMTISTAVIPINAESEIQYTEADLHEMMTYADAVAAGHVNRLNDEEDMNTLIFANSDNTKTMYYYGEDIKYTDENGTVRDKTNELTYSGGVYVNEDNDINVAIPTSLASGVTLTYEDIEITMTPEFTGSGSLTESSPTATLTSTPRGQADNVTYSSVFGSGISVRYTPMYSGIKEDIILSSYTGVYSFDFTIETNGLVMLPDTALEIETETETDDNISTEDDLNLSDSPNWYFATREEPTTPVAWLSEIYIYDSAGNTALGSVNVTQISQTEYALTVVADKTFLESESTVYPVTVDPSLTVDYNNFTIHDATIRGYTPSTNYGSATTLEVGGSYGSYSALKFLGLQNNDVFSSISKDQIKSATLTLYCTSKGSSKPTVYVSQYSPTASSSGWWFENTITYNGNGIAYSATGQTSRAISYSQYYSFAVTNIVKNWKDSPSLIEKGLLLRLDEEQYSSSSYSAVFASSEYTANTAYRPYLTINYAFSGIYKIINAGSGKNLNADNSNGEENDNVYQYKEDGTASQAFRIVYNSSTDTYNIYTICDEYGYGNLVGTSGDNVLIVEAGTDARWNIQRYSGDKYRIKSYGTSSYMTVKDGDTNDGSGSNTAAGAEGNVYLATALASTYQQWTLELIDVDGCVELTNMDLYTQINGDYCSSAAIKMLLDSYNVSKTEAEINSKQKALAKEDNWTKICYMKPCINHYLSGAGVNVTYRHNGDDDDNKLTTNEQRYYQILKSLLAGNPVIVNVKMNSGYYAYYHDSGGHYIVISGIRYVDNEFKFVIYDPYLKFKYPDWSGDDELILSANNLFLSINHSLFIYSED